MVNNYTPIPTSSGILKESEPITTSPEIYEIREEEEHQIDEEAKPYIGIKPQSIELPPDLQRLGIKSTPPTLSNGQSYQSVKLPISDDKVLVGLRAPVSSSFRWLATLALYILRHAHLGLKVVHGKVIRVLRG